MKKTTTGLLAMFMVLTGISAVMAFAAEGSQQLTLQPKSSGWITIDRMSSPVKVKFTAKADKGKVYIRIVDGSGKTITSGVNKVRFNAVGENTTYKAELTNKTNKIQEITVSYTDGKCNPGCKGCNCSAT